MSKVATEKLRLFAFPCGIESTHFGLVDPLDERAGETITGPDFLYVIEHPEGLVIVDSGVHPEMAKRLGDAILWRDADGVLGRLAAIGATPSDVRCVVQTHLHYDHAGGLPCLPGVPVFVQQRELAFARSPAVYQREFYHAPDFTGSMCWQPLDGEHDLFSDGQIVLVPTPGHTPGHQSVLVRLAGGPVLLGGDVHYSREKMRERRLPAIVWSPDAMVASWLAVEEIERRLGARLIVSHEPAYETEMQLGPDAWYE